MKELIIRGDALAVAQYYEDKVEGIKNLPAVEAVPVGQIKAQVIDLVKSLEVLLGCLGVSVLVKEIERMEVADPEEAANAEK